jgi:hypothetical protein
MIEDVARQIAGRGADMPRYAPICLVTSVPPTQQASAKTEPRCMVVDLDEHGVQVELRRRVGVVRVPDRRVRAE